MVPPAPQGPRSEAEHILVDGKAYHLRIAPGDIGEYVLAPGDPARIDQMVRHWDEAREVAFNRQYRVVTGSVQGTKVSAVSHGIGGASLEPAVNELYWAGARTIIRVGTTGSINPRLAAGDLVINTGAVRFDGTSADYVWPEYPAVADFEVVLALIQACEELGYRYEVGIGATMASFYTGQGRAAANGYRYPGAERVVQHLARTGVLNMEMEGAALLTLAQLLNMRAGMVAGVVADRHRNVFDDTGVEEKASAAATRAVAILAEWDRLKAEKGKRHVYPGLLRAASPPAGSTGGVPGNQGR